MATEILLSRQDLRRSRPVPVSSNVAKIQYFFSPEKRDLELEDGPVGVEVVRPQVLADRAHSLRHRDTRRRREADLRLKVHEGMKTLGKCVSGQPVSRNLRPTGSGV